MGKKEKEKEKKKWECNVSGCEEKAKYVRADNFQKRCEEHK